MKNNTRPSRIVLLLFGALILTSGAVQSEEIAGLDVKSFPGESPLIIPAAAFASDGNAPTEHLFNSNGFISGGSSTTCMIAPVYLPDGAEVTQLWASVVDMADTNMTVSLVRTNNMGYRSTAGMAVVVSNGNTYPSALTGWYGSSSIANPVIQYPEYSYFVHACLSSWRFQLYQVEIRFTESVIFRDGFESGNALAWSSSVGKAGETVDGIVKPIFDRDVYAKSTISPNAEKSVGYTSPLSIAPSEFKPNGSEADEVLVAFNDGVMYGANYSGSRWMHAPIYLPDGATITEITARVVDNDAGGGGVSNCASGTTSDVELFINRSKGCSGATCYDLMASASTSGASAAIQFLTPSPMSYPLVDGDEYGYFAVIRLCGPKHEVYGLRVSYTTP